MTGIPADTTIEALRKQYEILRRMGPEARVRMAFEMSDNMRRTVEAGARDRHPDWDDEQVNREVVRLMIGDELFSQVFGTPGVQTEQERTKEVE
jgi:hypothetical protein